MTGVIARQAQKHTCSPGWEVRHSDGTETDPLAGCPDPLGPHDYFHDLQCRPGDVWQCECGRVWVAEPNHYVNVFSVEWRRETRRERRKREKAAGA